MDRKDRKIGLQVGQVRDRLLICCLILAANSAYSATKTVDFDRIRYRYNTATLVGRPYFYKETRGDVVVHDYIYDPEHPDIKIAIECDGITDYGGGFDPLSVYSLDIQCPVAKVWTFGFMNWTKLNSIILPRGLKSIGDEAFEGCSSLKNISMQDGVEVIGWRAFADCSRLESISIPNSVTNLGISIFQGCKSLSDIKLPNGITELPAGCFVMCESLSSIKLPASLKNISGEAFAGTGFVTLPDLSNVTNIEMLAFSSCRNLTSIDIPDNVKTVGRLAFASGCDNLTHFSLSTAVKVLDCTFYKCGFEEIIIPSHVERLIYTFRECENLRKVHIPVGMCSIDECAFLDCKSLDDVTIPSTVTNIGIAAFQGTSLRSVEIPDSVTLVAPNAFSCPELVSVRIGKGVSTLENNSYESKNLVQVGGQFLGQKAGQFAWCGKLRDIYISSGVKNIDAYTFAYCRSITNVLFEGLPPTTLEQPYYSNGQLVRVRHVFDDAVSGAVGYYPIVLSEHWLKVIDEDGKWNGLKMIGYSRPTARVKVFENDSVVRVNWTGACDLPDVKYDVYRGKSETFSEAERVAENVKGVCWDDLSFTAEYIVQNAYELNYWVVAKNGDFEMGRSDVAKVTIAPSGELPVTFEPESANWKDGSITFMVTGVPLIGGVEFCLSYCDANADAEDWKDVNGDELSVLPDYKGYGYKITDPHFASRLGGIPSIKYRLKIGETTKDCITRTRRGIFVGVGEFGDDYGQSKPTPIPKAREMATKFRDLLKDNGQLADYHLLAGSDATYKRVDEAFSDFANKVKPGDVCVVYFLTHGGVYPDSTTGFLCLYDKPPKGDYHERLDYTENLLAHHIRMLDSNDKGVAVINIISACRSGALFNDSNEEMLCRAAIYWCQKEGLNSDNVAWVTAADYNAIASSIFNDFLLKDGWESGWADEGSTGVLSFLDLANYTKRLYDGLFNGIKFKGEESFREVKIVDDGALLGKIMAGTCKVPHGNTTPPPQPLNVYADKGVSNDKIGIEWDYSSLAQNYYVFYRFGEKAEYEIWYGGKLTSEDRLRVRGDFQVTEEGQQYQGEYDEFLSTTRESPAHFVVKAINGVGVSETSDTAEGWVRSLIEEKEDWIASADMRNVTIQFHEVVGTSVNAFELALDDDGSAVAVGEMADGSPIEVQTTIEQIVDDEAEIPLEWADKNGVQIGMVIRVSKSGKVTIKDGIYTRDGVPVEIEVIPEFGLLIKDGVLIGYEGEMPDGYEMIIPDGVTSIGYRAFYGCGRLKSVTIPQSVTAVHYEAFCGCDGLTRVDIADLEKWCEIQFYDESANPLSYAQCLYLNGGVVRDLRIPEGVTSVGSYSFCNCSGLLSVAMPSTVTNIGHYAFKDCRGFSAVTIPQNVTSIGWGAFYNCSGLASVVMPSKVSSIGWGAFYGCSGLTSMTIPQNVTCIADYAFYYCSGLSSVKVPPSVTNIGVNAFCDCWNLRRVLIPKSVNSIGQGAFMNCGSLSTICVEEGDEDRVRGLLSDSGLDVTSIMFVHEGEFMLNISEDGCLEGCVGWLPDSYDLVIPEGVRQINWYALSGLPIRSVHIPESCTWIGEGVFLGCENLMVVTGGDGLEYIAMRAFEGTPFMEDGEVEPDVAYVGRCAVGLRRSWMLDEMYSESDPDKWSYELSFRDGTVCVSGFDWLPITSIVFPDSVETIASDAFSKCDLLREVSFGENLREIEFGAFRTWDTSYDVWDTPEDTDRTPEIMELYFPAGLEYVGGDAFAGWDNLQTVYFEGRIGDWWTEGFPEGCELVSLTIQKLIVEDGIVKGLFDVVDKTGRESGDIVDGVLVLPDGVTAIDDFALSDAPIHTVVIPESCKRIGEYALAWCYDLEQVIGGNGVESVGYSAFEGSCLFDDWADEFGLVYVGRCLVGCKGRTALQTEFDAFEGDVWKCDLIIKDGVTSVGGLENLPFTSVTLPDSVVSIDNYAFECSSGWGWDDEPDYGVLERVELGKGLRTIGDLAFYGCRRLGVVSGGDAVERVGYYSFGNTGILPVDDDGAFEVVYIGKIAIGCRGKFPQGAPDDECCLIVREGTMMIAESAFSKCADIRAVSLPDSLKMVPAEAFSYCTNLKKISLGNGIEVIEDSAFANTALSKIDLPSNVLFVGAYAFGAYDDDFGMPEECELKPTLEEVVFHSDQIVFDSSAFLCRTTTFDTDAEMEFVEPEVAFSVGVLRSVRMELEGFELRGWRRKAADGADRAGNGNFGVDELSETFGIEGEWVWDDLTGWDDYVSYWVAPCVCPVGSPVVVGDDTARVTGDKERGFTIVPSEGVEDVVISVPSEVSAEKVVVELSPEVRSVVPNGVTIKIMRDAHDITSCLNIPSHDGFGRIDLTATTVKEEIVKETLDPSKDAVIELNAANPRLITAPTRKGLFYQLREGETLDGMKEGDCTIGDGKPWLPEITVKGGSAAFYSIGVGKGE